MSCFDTICFHYDDVSIEACNLPWNPDWMSTGARWSHIPTLQLLNEHMCIWNICSWDGMLPRPILFPPGCLRSLRPLKLWTPSQQPLRQAESTGWTAEPNPRQVTGRTPSLKCFLKRMNRSCIHSKHVSLECNDCLSSAMVESIQMSISPTPPFRSWQ